MSDKLFTQEEEEVIQERIDNAVKSRLAREKEGNSKQLEELQSELNELKPLKETNDKLSEEINSYKTKEKESTLKKVFNGKEEELALVKKAIDFDTLEDFSEETLGQLVNDKYISIIGKEKVDMNPTDNKKIEEEDNPFVRKSTW